MKTIPQLQAELNELLAYLPYADGPQYGRDLERINRIKKELEQRNAKN